MILLAERYDLHTGWMAKVRIEAEARCDRCKGTLAAGDEAYVRSEVPPDVPDEGDPHIDLMHLRGRCSS